MTEIYNTEYIARRVLGTRVALFQHCINTQNICTDLEMLRVDIAVVREL